MQLDQGGNMYRYENYLAHHGILGMKWGVRHDQYPLSAGEHTAAEKKAGYQKSIKNAFSLRAAGNKALAKVYSINEKVYKKANPTLSSMNKAAKEKYLQKAADAQKVANDKRKAKISSYRDKLAEKKLSKANSWDAAAKKEQMKLNDLNERGVRSKTYQKMIRDKYRGDCSRQLAASVFPDVKSLNEFRRDQERLVKTYKANTKKYIESHKELMNMSIDDFTSKKDIKRTAKAVEKHHNQKFRAEQNREIRQNIYGTSSIKKK